MVIEVVSWPTASKTHAVNQDNPSFTCCGSFIGGKPITRLDGTRAFPTCVRCRQTVMHS